MVSSHVARGFEIQAEGGEMMPEGVMQLARDPLALSHAAGIRQQLAGRPQLAVYAGEFRARACFACCKKTAKQGKYLKRHVSRHQGWYRSQRPSQCENGAHQHRLYHGPKEGISKRHEPAELGGDTN